MLRIAVPIASLLLSDAFLLIAHGLLLTLLPVAASLHGFSDNQVAITGSTYFLGFVSGCLVAPRVIRRAGHIRSFSVLGASYIAVALIFPVFPVFVSWLLLRFAQGMMVAGMYMIIESWLNERATAETRGTTLSLYTVVSLLMITVGQQMLNLGDVGAPVMFSVAAGFLALSIIPVSLTLILAPAPVERVSLNLRKVWDRSHTALGGAVATGLVVGGFWSVAPLYARSVGFDTFELALYMSLSVLGGAVFQLPLGRLSDHYDRRVIILIQACACALISLGIVFVPDLWPGYGHWPVILLAFVWGGFTLTQYAICLAHANDRADPGDFVMVGSSMLLTQALFSAIGAPLSTLTMHWFGPEGLYVFFALTMGCFAAGTLLRRQFHRLPALEEPVEPFRAVTELTTPVAYGMDPRTEEHHQAAEEEIDAAGSGAPVTESYTAYSPVRRDDTGQDGAPPDSA